MTNTDEIQRAAQALRDQERFQEQLKSTNTAGETAYGDQWGKALDKLSTFGQVDPADFAAILNTDDPAKVLYELGNNPAEYQRLMNHPLAAGFEVRPILSAAKIERPIADCTVFESPGGYS
jgi:hypothetical protein